MKDVIIYLVCEDINMAYERDRPVISPDRIKLGTIINASNSDSLLTARYMSTLSICHKACHTRLVGQDITLGKMIVTTTNPPFKTDITSLHQQ